MYRHQVYSLWLIIACLLLMFGANTSADSKAGPSKYRKYIKALFVFQATNLEAVNKECFEKKLDKLTYIYLMHVFAFCNF